jgi:uncharacterized protein (TIGR02757 family)
MFITKKRLERLYNFYNHRKFVHPDPLEFLYSYPDPLQMELAGLIASSLAYGRVSQILKSVSSILEKMYPSPRAFLLNSSRKDLLACFSGFRHRFTTGDEMAYMLLAAKHVIEEHGSLYACFMAGYNNDDTLLPALSAFVNELRNAAAITKNSLLPSPDTGSACKRLHLFLRWMVRKDRVDPGGWRGIPRSGLIIPLDTHMHKICVELNMTRRKSSDILTAMEITKVFRKIDPQDPVRYDFALTRLGIRKDADLKSFFPPSPTS